MLVRKWVIKTIHLPVGTPSVFLYLPLSDGGMGLVEFASVIPYRIVKCLYKMESSADSIGDHVAETMLRKLSRTVDLFSGLSRGQIGGFCVGRNRSLLSVLSRDPVGHRY